MELSEQIKALLGENYKDEMTPEDVVANLSKMHLADVSTGNYVSVAKHNDALEKARNNESKLKAEIAEKDKKLTEKMTEDEKAALAVKEQQEIVAKQAEEIRKLKVSNIFANNELTEEEYKPIVESGATEEIAKALVEALNAKTKSLNDEIKELKLGNFQSPDGGSGEFTKSFSEMSLEERSNLKEQNPTLYEKMHTEYLEKRSF